MSVRAAEEFSDPDIQIGRVRALLRRSLWLARVRIRDWLGNDLKHVELWTPVAIGLGAGFYFGLKSEPDAIWAFGALFAAAIAFFLGRQFRPVAAAFFLVALGFVAADFRVARLDAPILERELDIRSVTGKLVAIEDGADARRPATL